MEHKIYIDFFPKPSEHNPFMLKSKDDHFKVKGALFKLWSARDEWEDMIAKKNTPSENDVLRWGQLYKDYQVALKQGIQDRFKEEIWNWL